MILLQIVREDHNGAVINKSEPERQEAVILGEVWGLVVVMMVNYRHYLQPFFKLKTLFLVPVKVFLKEISV